MEHIKGGFILEVKKEKNYIDDRIYDIIIVQDENVLNISFGGDGDLYFLAELSNFEELNQIINFEITKENYELYTLFDKLYNTIINCNIYKINELDLELKDTEEKQLTYDKWNQELRKYQPYNLIQNGVISWRHDDQIFEEANTLNIYKEEDKYRLEFILKNEELYSPCIDIRFRNSGSRYQPFNIPFMELYKSLQSYNIEDNKQYTKNNNKKS